MRYLGGGGQTGDFMSSFIRIPTFETFNLSFIKFLNSAELVRDTCIKTPNQVNFLKISPSVHFVLRTRRVSPLVRIMTRVRYDLCPVSQLSYIMNVAAVLHLCSRTTSQSA